MPRTYWLTLLFLDAANYGGVRHAETAETMAVEAAEEEPAAAVAAAAPAAEAAAAAAEEEKEAGAEEPAAAPAAAAEGTTVPALGKPVGTWDIANYLPPSIQQRFITTVALFVWEPWRDAIAAARRDGRAAPTPDEIAEASKMFFGKFFAVGHGYDYACAYAYADFDHYCYHYHHHHHHHHHHHYYDPRDTLLLLSLLL